MIIAVATGNPSKLRAVEAVCGEAFGAGETAVQCVGNPVDTPDQPIGEEVAQSAFRRAKAACRSDGVDLGIGIEAGLITLPGTDRWMSMQVCVIVDREGRQTVGLGPGYELPPSIQDAVLSGEPLREAFERVLECSDAERHGAVFYLSKGRINREELTRQAVWMALIPRLGDGSRDWDARVPSHY
jgi:inosine/xanthosine triphosphatase